MGAILGTPSIVNNREEMQHSSDGIQPFKDSAVKLFRQMPFNIIKQRGKNSRDITAFCKLKAEICANFNAYTKKKPPFEVTGHSTC